MSTIPGLDSGMKSAATGWSSGEMDCTQPVGSHEEIALSSGAEQLQVCTGTEYRTRGTRIGECRLVDKNGSLGGTDCTQPVGSHEEIALSSGAEQLQVCTGTEYRTRGTRIGECRLVDKNGSLGGTGCTQPVGSHEEIALSSGAEHLQVCTGTEYRTRGTLGLGRFLDGSRNSVGTGCTQPVGSHEEIALSSGSEQMQVCTGTWYRSRGTFGSTAGLCVLGLTFAAILCLTDVSRAADAATSGLAAVLEEDTIGVIRIDSRKFDAAPLQQFLRAFGDYESQLGDIGISSKQLGKLVSMAGVSEVFLIFSAPELPTPSFLYVPLQRDTNDPELIKLMRASLDPLCRVDRKGNGYVAGRPEALARLARGKPPSRADVDAAFATVGRSALQLVFVPTDDHRRVVSEVLSAASVAGIPVKYLANAVRGGALGIELEPKAALKITVQAADNRAAHQLASLVGTSLGALGNVKLFGDSKPLREESADEYRIASKALQPSIQGDSVTVDVRGSEEVNTTASLLSDILDHTGLATASASGRNMRRILIGLHNYADTYQGRLPATAMRAKDGKPLLSWRVAILPMIGEEELYRQFKLDEPWDSDHNRKLIEKMPAIYRSTKIKSKERGLTTYLVPVGKEVAFTGGPTGRVMAKEFEDGMSNTILLLDVGDEKGVTWTKPDDLMVDLNDPAKGLAGHYRGFFLVGMADGVVRRVDAKMAKSLRAAFTCSGAETLGRPW